MAKFMEKSMLTFKMQFHCKPEAICYFKQNLIATILTGSNSTKPNHQTGSVQKESKPSLNKPTRLFITAFRVFS